MKNKTSIQLKAAFLLLVFALNTMVGFACVIGIDMGFNSQHHEQAATIPVVHVHADGKKHIHQEKVPTHADKKSHHGETDKSQNEKGDCCNDKVVKFDLLDKSIAKNFSTDCPRFFTAFVAAFFYKDASYASQAIPEIKYFVRSYHPPISDIRIAIRSFQI